MNASTTTQLSEDRPELAAARRTVALASLDVEDRARLLEMLGLVPASMRLTVEVP